MAFIVYYIFIQRRKKKKNNMSGIVELKVAKLVSHIVILYCAVKYKALLTKVSYTLLTLCTA